MTEQDREEMNEDQQPDEDREESEAFASLLDSYLTDADADIRAGEKISGEVISIGQDSVYVHIGGKEDGVVDKNELLDESGQLTCSEGDRLELFVVHVGDGEIRLSKSIAATGSTDLLYEAQQNQIPVEGRVVETCKGGFRVRLMGQTAFCPVSQIDIRYVEEPEAYVGVVYEFLIERIEEKGRNLVVSRRRHLERLRAEAQNQFLASVAPGDVVEGRVSRLVPFGAFIELQAGLEGLAHISELSWSRVADPSEALSEGDLRPVKILSMEEAPDKPGKIKISLSVKQAEQDPWLTVTGRLAVDQVVTGTVEKAADFGFFVALEPGITGLLPRSNLEKALDPKAFDKLSAGDPVTVRIDALDTDKRRITLSPAEEQDREAWKTYEKKSSDRDSGLGELGRKLQDAMNSGK